MKGRRGAQNHCGCTSEHTPKGHRQGDGHLGIARSDREARTKAVERRSRIGQLLLCLYKSKSYAARWTGRSARARRRHRAVTSSRAAAAAAAATARPQRMLISSLLSVDGSVT